MRMKALMPNILSRGSRDDKRSAQLNQGLIRGGEDDSGEEGICRQLKRKIESRVDFNLIRGWSGEPLVRVRSLA